MFHDRSLIRSSAGRVQYPCVKSAPDGTSHVTERCSPFIDKTPHRIRGSMWMGWERGRPGGIKPSLPLALQGVLLVNRMDRPWGEMFSCHP